MKRKQQEYFATPEKLLWQEDFYFISPLSASECAYRLRQSHNRYLGRLPVFVNVNQADTYGEAYNFRIKTVNSSYRGWLIGKIEIYDNDSVSIKAKVGIDSISAYLSVIPVFVIIVSLVITFAVAGSLCYATFFTLIAFLGIFGVSSSAASRKANLIAGLKRKLTEQ